jgi:hypothetical protein
MSHGFASANALLELHCASMALAVRIAALLILQPWAVSASRMNYVKSAKVVHALTATLRRIHAVGELSVFMIPKILTVHCVLANVR